MNDTELERRRTEIDLAKLEVKVSNLEQKFDKHTEEEHEDRKEIAEALAAIRNEQLAIRLQLTKYQGWAGGILLIINMLWAGLQMFGSQIYDRFKGH